MKFMKGYTWGFYSTPGLNRTKSADVSMDLLISRVSIDTVVIPVLAFQEKVNSIDVSLDPQKSVTIDDIEHSINMANEKGLRVVLKAMVDVNDGTWRAFISFFDEDVICEPTWEDWFQSYGKYVLVLAKIAEKYNVEMFCIGCEMVSTDHREIEWRKLIAKVRNVYSGKITYNCDKYQEHNVKWWDAVDVISSSGYYPINEIGKEFKRIEKVVDKYGKPFVFLEAGCPSRNGSEHNPNDWGFGGKVSTEHQALWYKKFIEEVKKNHWINGVTWWDWPSTLYNEHQAMDDGNYCIYAKPAEKILKEFYESI